METSNASKTQKEDKSPKDAVNPAQGILTNSIEEMGKLLFRPKASEGRDEEGASSLDAPSFRGLS